MPNERDDGRQGGNGRGGAPGELRLLDRREGSCTSGCGACCRFLVLQVNPQYRDQGDIQRWIELHGIRLVERGGYVWAYIPTPCSQLAPDGTCGIHETRPDVCREWPQSEAQIVELHEYVGEEVCSYRFSQER